MMLLNMAISTEAAFAIIGFFAVITIAACLFLTLLTEMPVCLLVTSEKRFLKYCLICNILTNPPLNIAGLVLLEFCGHPAYEYFIAAGEIAVLFIETALYYFLDKRKTSVLRCFLLSLACNLVSFIAGLGITFILQHISGR